MTTSHSKSAHSEAVSSPRPTSGGSGVENKAPSPNPSHPERSRGAHACQAERQSKPPKQISRFLDLVRCESLRDFLHPQKMTRIKNMPFWILADEKQQTMWFDHVTPDLKKDELLRYIRSGLIYIRRSDAKAKETLSNTGANPIS